LATRHARLRAPHGFHAHLTSTKPKITLMV
jgi:hypothetical protein